MYLVNHCYIEEHIYSKTTKIPIVVPLTYIRKARMKNKAHSKSARPTTPATCQRKWGKKKSFITFLNNKKLAS